MELLRLGPGLPAALSLALLGASAAHAGATFRTAEGIVAVEVPGVIPQTAGDELGSAVAVGDFNGDGFGDVAMGAPFWNIAVQSYFDVGRVLVVDGTSEGVIPMAPSRAHQYYVGDSETPFDRFGSALAVGDFDGDGYDDLAVSAPGANWNGHEGEGCVYGFYGSPTGLIQTGGSSFDLFTQSDLSGSTSEPDDAFGTTLAVGDFNRDSYDDLAIGVPLEDQGAISNSGMIHVVWGSAGGLTATGTFFFNQSGLAGQVIEAGDRFGAALTAGDIDGDGYDDLAIGSPGEDSEIGLVAILRGGPGTSPGATGRWQIAPSDGVGFGDALAIGDFDGDGFGDLAVGEPQANSQGGRVRRYPGTASGPGATPVSHPKFVPARFGAALLAVDLDGNGVDELVVGAPLEEIVFGSGDPAQGVVYVGSFAAGTTWLPLHQNSPGIPDTAEAGDAFGSALACGDIDGDDVADLVVGVPGEDWLTGVDAGTVQAIYFESVLIFRDDFESGNLSAWD
ncbi:MAG: FG-GAP-like repeat-containing protein [Thermoanaerobaculia bacterium]